MPTTSKILVPLALMMSLLSTNCSPIRVIHAANTDDSPIIIADGGTPIIIEGDEHRGRPMPTRPSDAARTLALVPGASHFHHDRDDANGHNLKFGDGFYIKESTFRAVCLEVPAYHGEQRQVVDLTQATLWSIAMDDGIQFISGNTSGDPYNNNNLISISSGDLPIVPKGRVASNSGGANIVVSDLAYALTHITVTTTIPISGAPTTKTATFPAQPPAAGNNGLTFAIHYCKNGTCPADPFTHRTACQQ